MRPDVTIWLDENDDEWRAGCHPARTTDYGSTVPASVHLRQGRDASTFVVQSVAACDALIGVLTEAREFLAAHEVPDAEIVDGEPVEQVA